MRDARVIVLEAGVDGEALEKHGPDLANKIVRRERWGRLERRLGRLLSRTREVERDQVWEEKRGGVHPPCEDSCDVNEMFATEGAERARIRIRRVIGAHVFYVALIQGRRGYVLRRMSRRDLLRDYRRIDE